jgi:prevent-host-death family protein
MRQVDVHEAKTHFSRILEEVEAGERVVIVRAGKPIAVLAPCIAAVRRRQLGLFAGQVKIASDFEALPSDIADAFGA